MQLFSPKSGSLDTAYNDCAVFVDDTDFLTIRGPFHVCDHTLVPVVDHLLKPMLFVHHPDDDQTSLIGCGQLLVLIVPLDDLDLTRVALKWLIHAEISTALAFSGIELEDLQKTLVTADGDVAFLLIPSNCVHRSVDTDLQERIRTVREERLTFLLRYANILKTSLFIKDLEI